MKPTCGPKPITPDSNGAQLRHATPIGADLLIEVTDGADKELLRQELRRAPVQVPIKSVPIMGAGMDQIVSETGHCREFVTELRIGISVTAAAAVGSAVTNADIGEIGRIVVADRNVAGAVQHPVMDTVVPARDNERIEIAGPGRGLADRALSGSGQRSSGERQRAV